MRYRPPQADEIVLARHEGRLEARGSSDQPGSGVRAAWPAPWARPRGSALLRAMGDASSVIDATLGLGVDAWTLACAGRRVWAVERSMVVASLALEALEEAGARWPEQAARVSIMHADSRSLLPALVRQVREADPNGAAPAVYLDPMFPPRRRASALPSKQMQFLAALVGSDADAGELLETARGSGASRVVVKRSPRAPALGAGVAFSIATKLLRFDVYLPRESGGRA